MNTKDGPELARRRQQMAEVQTKRAAAQNKNADKNANKHAQPRPAMPATRSSLELFAMRDNRLRSETWRRPSEKEARALLAGLTPGKDCDVAVIADGDREYILKPKNRGRDGTEFRHVVIQPRSGHFAVTPPGLFLLLNYRSSLVPNEWYPFESARVTAVPPNTVPPNTVPPNAVPPKGQEPSRVVVSFPTCDIWLDPSRDYLVTEILWWRLDRSQKTTRTVCEYEQAPAPLDWVPKKFTATWLPGNFLSDTVEECVTVDWATGDDKVPAELFELDYPDGTMIVDSTEDNGQMTKASIAWHGKLVPVSVFRLYSESLERVKKGQPAIPDGKK
jgi:hypothetical protein